jgi:hypothetical protein
VSTYTLTNEKWRGTELEIGRIPRQQIDKFIAGNPQPEPPERLASEIGIDVWGDPDAMVVDRSDAEYQAQFQMWQVAFGEELLEFIAEAVQIPESVIDNAERELAELSELGICDFSTAAILRFILCNQDDLASVVSLVLYESTVTARGLQEAQKLYNVRWNGKQLSVISKPSGNATASGVFSDRISAERAHCKWTEFCELPGPEQSAIVALHRLQNRLEYLQSIK